MLAGNESSITPKEILPFITSPQSRPHTCQGIFPKVRDLGFQLNLKVFSLNSPIGGVCSFSIYLYVQWYVVCDLACGPFIILEESFQSFRIMLEQSERSFKTTEADCIFYRKGCKSSGENISMFTPNKCNYRWDLSESWHQCCQ